MSVITSFLILILSCKTLFSLPQNMSGIEGEVHLQSSSPLSLEVTSSDGALIDWDSFSIAPSETVTFDLPHSNACVLNRVIGSDPSEIFGSLKSIGKVILINPNGVLFGSDSRVDVGSLIASTFDLQRDLYAKSKEISWIKSETLGRIQHNGQIHAGRIELQASEIYLFENSLCQASKRDLGGEILIGDRELTSFVWADSGARIFADALEQGPGGKVLLLSSGMTDFQGYISARGGPNGGAGGFAEVSGGHLSYTGFADLRTDDGGAGTLLLDPTNITIGPATLNNTAIAGFTFPLACGGVSPLPGTRNTTTAPFVASTISVAILTGQIALANVIIDSTIPGAAFGNITWNAGADFAYTSAFDLILRAPATGTVTILSNVQNSGTGDVIIDTLGPSVLINFDPNTQAVSFGSLQGLSQICAPNGDITIQCPNVAGFGNRYAQLGFYAGDGTTATGPILVTCRNLSLFGSPRTQCYAQIGHGQMGNLALATLITTPNATIDIAALGNITLNTAPQGLGSADFSAAIIGHGQLRLNAGSSLEGGITVASGGNITLISHPRNIGGRDSISAKIGHGRNNIQDNVATTITADINVQAAGNIQLAFNNMAFPLTLGINHLVMIGHYSSRGTITGDITVVSGGDIIFGPFGGGGGPNAIRECIGSLLYQTGAAPANSGTVTSNIRVFACQDILLTGGREQDQGIGSVNGQFTRHTVIGDVEIVAGRDIIGIANDLKLNVQRLGNNYVTGAVMTRTFVAAGRDITLSSISPPGGVGGTGIGGFGDIYVAARRNITLIRSGVVAGAPLPTFIGTEDSANAITPRLVRVFAGGNIVCSNPDPGLHAHIGRDAVDATAFPYTSSVEIRAGGDIQLSSQYTTNGAFLTPTTGNYFIEADTQLPAGALWTAGGGVVTSICQVTPNLPILQSAVCPATIFAANAPAIISDGRGGVRFDTGGNAQSFGILTSAGGNITLHSAQFQTNGTPQNLTIGTGVNNANISVAAGGSGNIEIWGTQTSANCQRGNSFNNITLNSALTTTGSVLLSANTSLFMTAASSINTSGGNSPVTLIVDNAFPFPPLFGQGLFDMSSGSTITSGTGLLQIYTALQNLNIINGMLNNSTFAPGTLFVDTNQEIWCTYFCAPLPGNPFTISYKNCLQQLTAQAMVIVDQFLVDLHPYNEFPGWRMEFDIKFAKQEMFKDHFDEPYFIRRRHLNIINQPKSYTAYQETPRTL